MKYREGAMKALLFAVSIILVFGTAYGKDVECVSTLDSSVCVGESHDSVIAKLPKSSVLGQTVSQGQYGPIVRREYLITGHKVFITFGRPGPDGPHRVLKIEE